MVRALILAALAWLILATSPPQRQRPEENRQSTQGITTSLENVAAAIERERYNPDCEPGSDNRRSDLCAQWKAADAASESAGWAKWFFWLTVIGTAIGAATLGAAAAAAFFAKKAADHTETGAKAATDAVAETKRIGEAQVRAYLSIKSAHVWIDRHGQPWVEIVVVNSGQSPAREFRWAHHVAVNSPDPKFHWIGEPIEIDCSSSTIDIPAGETEPLTVGIATKQLTGEELEMFRASGRSFFKVKICIAWEDIFKESFREIHNFQAMLEGRNAVGVSKKLYPDTTAVHREPATEKKRERRRKGTRLPTPRQKKTGA